MDFGSCCATVRNIHKYNPSILDICSPTLKFVRQDNKNQVYTVLSQTLLEQNRRPSLCSVEHQSQYIVCQTARNSQTKPCHVDAEALRVGSSSSPVGPFEAFGGLPQPCSQRSACSKPINSYFSSTDLTKFWQVSHSIGSFIQKCHFQCWYGLFFPPCECSTGPELQTVYYSHDLNFTNC